MSKGGAYRDSAEWRGEERHPREASWRAVGEGGHLGAAHLGWPLFYGSGGELRERGPQQAPNATPTAPVNVEAGLGLTGPWAVERLARWQSPAVALHPAVAVEHQTLRLANTDSFAWRKVQLVLNARAPGDGY